MRFLEDFRLAVGFLTVLPVGKTTGFAPERMVYCFPLAGLFLGGIGALFFYSTQAFWPDSIRSLLTIVLFIIFSGGLHLDGLGDTADGLYGKGPMEKALEIMKDSRVGVMGLLAVLTVLAVKWAGLIEIRNHAVLCILIIPAYSRGAMIFGMHYLPYCRESGTGRPFFNHSITLKTYGFLLAPILLSFFSGTKGICINLVFILGTWGVLWYYKNRMGCITGDMLGAMCEIMEALLFLCAAVCM